MKKILITGGTGLVGSSIREISDTFYNYDFIFVSTRDCNLISFADCNKLFEKVKPDYVIHLAACVGGLYKNMSQPIKMLEDNLLININVLKCAKNHLVDKLIACLSTCVFPDNISGKINESMLNDGPPHSSNEGYSYAKRLLEFQCRTYNEQYLTNFICIIPTNIYGPNDNFNLQDSHVIPALIHNCYLAKQNNKIFSVKGTGKPLRQFIYSKDLAKIIMEILLTYKLNESMIISPTQEYSIMEVAKIINSHFENKITTCPEFADGQFSKTADNSKLLDFLPNFKFTDLHTGILETVNWFKLNYTSCRK